MISPKRFCLILTLILTLSKSLSAATCKDLVLSNETNGALDDSCINATIGDTCKVFCNDGYYNNGTNSNATCTDAESSTDDDLDGIWQVAANACSPVKCNSTLSSETNGTLNSSCSDASFNETCQVICAEGYYNDGGDNMAVCKDEDPMTGNNSNGIWNVSGVTCSPYMILGDNQNFTGVKGKDVNVTVTLLSYTDEVNITAVLSSAPNSSLNGSPLELISNDSGSLTYGITLYDVEESDGGEYTIEVSSESSDTNKYPNISSNVVQTLDILVIPENFTFVLNGNSPVEENYTYIRGDANNIITCRTYAVPEATYSWENSTESQVSKNAKLIMESFYFSDNGTYTCTASNEASIECAENPSKDIEISVTGIPVMMSIRPSSSVLRDDINITCFMDANPPPLSVSWINNENGEIDFSSDVFASISAATSNVEDGYYYQYKNEIALVSQLCRGSQTISCSSENDIGNSGASKNITINSDLYYMNSDSYIFNSTDVLNYAEARSVCDASSGHLVYVIDEDIKTFLQNSLDYEFYTGAVRGDNGDWTWGPDGDLVISTSFIDDTNGNCSIFNVSDLVAVQCNESYPYVCQIPASGVPQNLTASTSQCSGNELNISWVAADDNFMTTQHRLIIKDKNTFDTFFNSTTTEIMNFHFSNATPNTEYEVQVFAGVNFCLSYYTPSSSTSSVTGFGETEEVSDATMANYGDNTECKVSWKYDTRIQWQISSYEVEITLENMETEDDETDKDSLCVPGVETNCIFDMIPNTRYSASITAISSCGKFSGPVEIKECISEVAPPSEVNIIIPQEDETIDARDGITVRVLGQNEANGSISCLFIILTTDSSRESSDKREPIATTTMTSGHKIAYATDKVSGNFTFTIGSDESPGECSQIPSNSRKKRSTTDSNLIRAERVTLYPNNFYRYYVVSATPNGTYNILYAASAISPVIATNYYAWVAAIVVPLFLIIVAVAYYYYRKKRNHKNDRDANGGDRVGMSEIGKINEGYTEDTYENIEPVLPKRNRINSRDLENVYVYKHKDDDRQFRDDFKSLTEMAKRLAPNFSEAKQYRGLNRFVNVLPSNEACVHIKPTPENQTGYINASYINGYSQEKKFIATQGPKPNTIADFWSMIWEQNIEAIVMLTNVIENGKRKCEKYWPNKDESITFGRYHVICDLESELGPIIIRKFRISSKGHEQSRSVVQYHYISWPDHGVPLTTTDLFNLRRIVRMEHNDNTKPIAVHCSAGVGRTGTFISLDYLMDELEDKNSVDVADFVWSLRGRRTEMVQTADQFVLIHKMLLEQYLLKQSDSDVPSVEEKIERIDTGSQAGLVEMEFKNAGRVKPLDTDQERGSSPDHMRFNRDRKVIPYDHNIVSIRMRPEETVPPYLNASLIQGYEINEKFIATQDPLPGTEEIFWRMVLDNNVKCVVAIKKPGDSQDHGAKYWPDQKSQDFGRVTVSVLESYTERNFIQRNIFVKEVVLTAARSVTIHHFEFRSWPAQPNAGVGPILDLISRVRKERMSGDARTGPVVVHCGNGSEYVGTFCAITNILERLQNENRVDVLRTVKDLRDMRPGMVGTLDEYKLCYAAIKEQLSSFELYSNFR